MLRVSTDIARPPGPHVRAGLGQATLLGSRRDLGSVPPFKASPDLDFPARRGAGRALLALSLLPAPGKGPAGQPGLLRGEPVALSASGASVRWLTEPCGQAPADPPVQEQWPVGLLLLCTP